MKKTAHSEYHRKFLKMAEDIIKKHRLLIADEEYFITDVQFHCNVTSKHNDLWMNPDLRRSDKTWSYYIDTSGNLEYLDMNLSWNTTPGKMKLAVRLNGISTNKKNLIISGTKNVAKAISRLSGSNLKRLDKKELENNSIAKLVKKEQRSCGVVALTRNLILDTWGDIKAEFSMEPYRFCEESCLSEIGSNQKSIAALSLLVQGYDFDNFIVPKLKIKQPGRIRNCVNWFNEGQSLKEGDIRNMIDKNVMHKIENRSKFFGYWTKRYLKAKSPLQTP